MILQRSLSYLFSSTPPFFLVASVIIFPNHNISPFVAFSKVISIFLNKLKKKLNMMNFRNNMQKCQEYIKALDEERKKIQVFHRELPLCLELVTQAIEACKQQLRGTGTTTTDCVDDHSECSVQTTSDGPILEEFIPLKWSNSTTDDDEEELESNKSQINDINLNDISEKSGKKSDWLSSVQLWNQTPDSATTQEEHQPKKVTVVEVKRSGSGGAFHPFQKEKSSNEHEINNNNTNNNNKPTSNQAASSCSSAQEADMGPSSGGNHGGGGGGNKKEKDGQSQRKARRCWSPELHRRFVHALKQLGGSHVATPKQIRDLMKVDGLTNDEVKSHLQKYRLHTRRPSSAVHNNANQQAPQFVVVGGIWVPHAATTAGDTTTVAAPGGIYAPVATVAAPPPMHQTSSHRQQQKQSSQSHCVERASHSEGGVHSNSNSPATSSSTHTTTASHAN